MENKKEIIAQWNVDLHVDCPYCDDYISILDDWAEQEMWSEVQAGETKKLYNEFEINCPKCKKDFIVTETQH